MGSNELIDQSIVRTWLKWTVVADAGINFIF
jgi:hypothetical protein